MENENESYLKTNHLSINREIEVDLTPRISRLGLLGIGTTDKTKSQWGGLTFHAISAHNQGVSPAIVHHRRLRH